MALIDEIRAANERYAATFSKGDLPMPPGRKFAVVACMDARLDPAKALGLEEGDAHVIRNAGGRAADALRSLIISQRLLGTEEVIVVHHTDCGMLTFDNATLHGKLKDDLGADASDIDFLPYSGLEASVREDVALIRNSPLIPDDIHVRGFIYDVKTGRIHELPESEVAEAWVMPTARSSVSRFPNSETRRREWRDLLGPMLTVVQVQRQSDLRSLDEIEALVGSGSLLAVPNGENSEPLFPEFQFADDGTMDATVAQVVRIFSGVVATPYTTASWFFGPKPYLEGEKPIDWIRAGRDPKRVIQGARTAASRLAQ